MFLTDYNYLNNTFGKCFTRNQQSRNEKKFIGIMMTINLLVSFQEKIKKPPEN